MEDLYRVEDCRPAIPDKNALQDLMRRVNAYDDGSGLIVKGMRSLWLAAMGDGDCCDENDSAESAD